MKENYLYKTASPLGDLLIVAEDQGVSEIRFLPLEHSFSLSTPSNGPAGTNLKQAIAYLDDYLKKRAPSPAAVPLKLEGTEFQKRVWQSLLKIEYGKTWSYSELGKSLQPEAHPRPVGHAVGQNPLAILVPCHRVLGKRGDLVGYEGGLFRKEFLLKLEESAFLGKTAQA